MTATPNRRSPRTSVLLALAALLMLALAVCVLTGCGSTHGSVQGVVIADAYYVDVNGSLVCEDIP